MPKTKNAKKYFLLPNTVYGNWRTIEEVQIQTKKCTETRWRCVYIPTGEVKLCVPATIARYQTGDQQDAHNRHLLDTNSHQMGFRRYLYRNSKRNAKSRNHDFDLSFEEYDNIIQQECAYCGSQPQTNQKLVEERGSTKEPLFYYNGIDRIDSKRGYSIDNCVPCCAKCNYMKRTYEKEEFFSHIKLIYEHMHLGSTTISEESTSQA